MALLSEAIAAGSSGVVANTNQVHKKLNALVYDVKSDFNAVGDGTTNDTAAVQAAIDAATTNGAIVWFPVGTYDLANVTWKPNIIYAGVRGKSILTIRTGASYLGSCDSGSASAFISNMTFDGLTFRGRVDVDTTFDQQRHLLNLNGVENIQVTNCQFIGWHGDAIYLGSSNTGGVERHNKRIRIVGNYFDGMTKNNRNCVSVIDGDDILVQGNTARRFSRSDMPGFVDVEPNSGAATFGVVRNIRVLGNYTEDHNQNFFQLNLPGAMTNNPTGFLIANNVDDAGQANTNCRFAYLAYARTGPLTAAATRQDVQFVGNICRNSGYPVEIEGGIVGVSFRANLFEDIWGGAILGYWNNLSRKITFEGNEFVRCGYGEGKVIRPMFTRDVAIINNDFVDCGVTAGGNGVLVAFDNGESASTSDNTDFINNRISGTLTTAISSKNATHTLTAANNLRRLYRENGLTINTAHFGTLV